MHRLIVLALMAVPAVLGQPPQPHALWSPDSAVVVADLVQGQSHEQNGRASVRATLIIRRTLQGRPQPGDVLAVAWDYSALGLPTLSETHTVVSGTGLWVLNPNGSAWHPRPLTNSFPGTMGGVVLPVPAGALAPAFTYSPEAATATKFASELAASLAEVAEQQGDALNPYHSPDEYSYGSTAEQTWFAERATLLRVLPAESTRQVFRTLAASPLPHLQMIGIAGMLDQSDPAALPALERNFAALARTRFALDVAGTLNPELLRLDADAPATLGRLALSETVFPELERSAPFLLASTHRLQVLPYLMAMLESPSFLQRWTTVRGLCELLQPIDRNPPELQALWDNGAMSSQCLGERVPPDDAQAEAVFRFWRAWWVSTLPRLQSATGLAAVAPPERYRSGPFSRPVERAAFTREQWLVMCARNYGSWLREPAERKKAHSGFLMNPGLDRADQTALAAIFAQAYQGLKDTDEYLRRAQVAARAEGRPTDPAAVQLVRNERARLSRTALDRIASELSAGGAARLFATMDRFRMPGHASIEAERRTGRR